MRSLVTFGLGVVLAAGLAAAARLQPPAQPEPPTENFGTATAPDGAEMLIVGKKSIAVVIEDVKLGEGAEIKGDARITINYHGTLASDGSVFDSTYKEGKTPATFQLRQLIPGWQLGLQGMKEGGIRRLTISPELAYGVGERPGIPGNSTLVFWIELVKVEGARPPGQRPGGEPPKPQEPPK